MLFLAGKEYKHFVQKTFKMSYILFKKLSKCRKMPEEKVLSRKIHKSPRKRIADSTAPAKRRMKLSARGNDARASEKATGNEQNIRTYRMKMNQISTGITGILPCEGF